MTNLKESNIKDILPLSLKNISEVVAIGNVVNKNIKKLLELLSHSLVECEIDSLPEDILDVRAVELNVPYYNANIDIDKKRNLIKNVIKLYRKAGTKDAINEMISYTIGSGNVEEWYEFNGEPGTFKIRTAEKTTEDSLILFKKILRLIKPASATLLSVELGQKLESNLYIGAGSVMAYRISIK